MQNLEVFLDIDGCLIDEKYQFTVPLAEVQKKITSYFPKMKIHLNSNRSLKSILSIWDQVKFNGLLIYENGQGVFDPNTGLDACSPGIPLNRDNLIKVLGKLADGIYFVSTDELLRNPGKFKSSDRKSIYCEESRIFTSTIYPRVNVGGIPEFQKDFSSRVLELVRATYEKDYDIQTSDTYGNIILTPRGSLKSNPMKNIAGNRKIASFGDQQQDLLMFKESSKTLIGCPVNASPEVKEFIKKNKGFLATTQYTQGVLDFFDYLNNKLVE